MNRILRDGRRESEKFSYTNWAHLACENGAEPRGMAGGIQIMMRRI